MWGGVANRKDGFYDKLRYVDMFECIKNEKFIVSG